MFALRTGEKFIYFINTTVYYLTAKISTHDIILNFQNQMNECLGILNLSLRCAEIIWKNEAGPCCLNKHT